MVARLYTYQGANAKHVRLAVTRDVDRGCDRWRLPGPVTSQPYLEERNGQRA